MSDFFDNVIGAVSAAMFICLVTLLYLGVL